MVNTTNKVVATVQRKGDIVAAKPQRHTALRKAAETLSRRNVDQAVVELLNEALGACVRLVYERNDDGTPSSVDHVTARILVPLPWGRAGCARWGLRRMEGDVMRKVMLARQDGPGLFLYDRSRRSWFLNVTDYPSLRSALGYVAQQPIGVREYRQCLAELVGRT